MVASRAVCVMSQCCVSVLLQKVHKDDVLDRLTDTSKYTGSHKERFDESGKGKGLAGRDLTPKGGGMSAGCVGAQASYVQGYRHEGTYEKKVKQ